MPAADVAAGAMHRARLAAEAAGLEIEFAAGEAAEVSGRVAGLAGLALANLLSNAIEASPRGARIRLSLLAAGDAVEFKVADAAGGLPAAVQASLFQPVVSTKRHGGGMGLAISRRLARHAGGDLLLERTGPDGTTFVLRVPAWRKSGRGAV